MKNSVAILVMLFAALSITSSSVATVVRVPSDQPSIQRGINAVGDGDTVLVWPGVYNETATHGINFSGKAITVKSAADAAVLEVPGFTAATFALGENENSVLSNFVIKGSTTGIFALFATYINSTVNRRATGTGTINAIKNFRLSSKYFYRGYCFIIRVVCGEIFTKHSI